MLYIYISPQHAHKHAMKRTREFFVAQQRAPTPSATGLPLPNSRPTGLASAHRVNAHIALPCAGAAWSRHQHESTTSDHQNIRFDGEMFRFNTACICYIYIYLYIYIYVYIYVCVIKVVLVNVFSVSRSEGDTRGTLF